MEHLLWILGIIAFVVWILNISVVIARVRFHLKMNKVSESHAKKS